MFGNIDGSKGTGWDITAISDKAHDYAGELLCNNCSSTLAECMQRFTHELRDEA
jgi:hypothetical protein